MCSLCNTEREWSFLSLGREWLLCNTRLVDCNNSRLRKPPRKCYDRSELQINTVFIWSYRNPIAGMTEKWFYTIEHITPSMNKIWMLLNTILSRLIHDSLTSLALEQVCMMGRRLQCGKLTQRTLIHVLDYSIILRISIYHELVHETKENHVYKNERKHLYIHAQYTQTLH